MRRATSVSIDGSGHLRVLEGLDGAGHVSQRRVGEVVGMAASRVNRIIRSLVQDGRVEVVDETVRPFAYALTQDGRAYLQELSYDRYASVVGRFRQLQRRVLSRLRRLRAQGVRRVAFYGAGEVMDVVRPLAEQIGLRVVTVVDDDPGKHGPRADLMVVGPDQLLASAAEAVVITTFRHAQEIRSRIGPVASGHVQVVEL